MSSKSELVSAFGRWGRKLIVFAFRVPCICLQLNSKNNNKRNKPLTLTCALQFNCTTTTTMTTTKKETKRSCSFFLLVPRRLAIEENNTRPGTSLPFVCPYVLNMCYRYMHSVWESVCVYLREREFLPLYSYSNFNFILVRLHVADDIPTFCRLHIYTERKSST